MEHHFRIVVATESDVSKLGAIDITYGHALVCIASKVSQTVERLQKMYPGSLIVEYIPVLTERVNLIDIDEHVAETE